MEEHVEDGAKLPTMRGVAKVFFVGWNLVVIGSAYFVWRDGTFLVEGVR